MMNARTTKVWVMTAAMTLAGASLANDANVVPTTSSTGQVQVANKFATPIVPLVGQDNALALARALRTGTTATLTFATTSPTGEITQTEVLFEVPTRPMGWGNVSHALALTTLALQQQGITNPTAAQLQAALDGGTITTADGRTVTLAGVLQQRASGMGWGNIAKSYDTTMGAVNRGLKAPTVASASRGTGTTQVSSTERGITTAGGAPSPATAKKTTVAGTGTAHGGKGITTASGTPAAGSTGTVTAAGNGHGQALGRGIVTASAGHASGAATTKSPASGVVTAAGSGASAVTTAAGRGEGNANAHGKGKHGG
jgi:hypothetical protein